VDRLVVVEEVRRETLFRRGVAVGVRPNVLGVLVCPRGPDRLADALDPEFRFELVGIAPARRAAGCPS